MTSQRVAKLRAAKQQDRLILVDIENIAGGAVRTRGCASWARHQIELAVDIRGDAQVVVGTSHIGCLNTALAWPDKRYVVRSGPDGADLALLDEIRALRDDRYNEIVLVSGDGIFADAVARLVSRGANVTIVAHAGQCANRLRLAAHRTVYIHDDYKNGTAVGAA